MAVSGFAEAHVQYLHSVSSPYPDDNLWSLTLAPKTYQAFRVRPPRMIVSRTVAPVFTLFIAKDEAQEERAKEEGRQAKILQHREGDRPNQFVDKVLQVRLNMVGLNGSCYLFVPEFVVLLRFYDNCL